MGLRMNEWKWGKEIAYLTHPSTHFAYSTTINSDILQTNSILTTHFIIVIAGNKYQLATMASKKAKRMISENKWHHNMNHELCCKNSWKLKILCFLLQNRHAICHLKQAYLSHFLFLYIYIFLYLFLPSFILLWVLVWFLPTLAWMSYTHQQVTTYNGLFHIFTQTGCTPASPWQHAVPAVLLG